MSKVLLVKYRCGSREALADILRHAGHDVIQAAGTGASLKEACRERPDIVLLDVSTQPQDGFKSLVRLREDAITADVPVILLAGPSRVVGEQEALRLGANHYLTMPWKPEIVEATIKVALSEPLIAADQTEQYLQVIRSRPLAKTPQQRADPRPGVPFAKRIDSPPKLGQKKPITPLGLDWQAVVKDFIVKKYGNQVGSIQTIKFARITQTGPVRGLNIYKLEGVTTMLVGNIPSLEPKGFSITVWATRDGRIVDRRGKIQ